VKITIEFEVDEKSLFQKTSAGSAVLGLEVLLEHLRSVKAREPEDSGVQQVGINGPPTECPTHGTVFPLLVGCPLCVARCEHGAITSACPTCNFEEHEP
jgi:hypothetical protein